MNKNELFRQLPKMDELLEKEELKSIIERVGRKPVLDSTNVILAQIRSTLSENPTLECLNKEIDSIPERVIKMVDNKNDSTLKNIINATGIVLHTNLGRAPMPKQLINRLMESLNGYMNLEYDLEEGKRGERYSHLEKLICEITGAESAMAVNNNASAVLLMCSAMGEGKEIIVSRGEQIEIGGKFRIPDIIDRSRATMIEVGTTNKTHVSDFEEKINENTAALLKVHTSNYRIIGFTESVDRKELVDMARKHDVPVIEDIGSGVLINLAKYGLQHEPTVQESIASGVDLVSFSGDKLLGGIQAGIIVGKKKYVDMCKKHPLTRAMRIDKTQALLIAEIFKMYRDEDYAVKNIPVLSMLTANKETLINKAKVLEDMLKKSITNKDVRISIVETENLAGGGSLPEEILPGVAIAIKDKKLANEHEANLRHMDRPIVAYVKDDALHLELRTIMEEDFELVVANLVEEYK